MKSNKKIILTKKRHVLLFILIIGTILALSAHYYFSYEANIIRRETNHELKSIAELKSTQIANWNNERIADLKIYSRSLFFVKGIENWINEKHNNKLKAEVSGTFSLINSDSIYEDIIITDSSGKLLLSTKSLDTKLDLETIPYINKVVKDKETLNTGLYKCSKHNNICLDYIAPIISTNKEVIAVLIFRVDPGKYLYPLIWEWPVPSKTSETILVKKENDNVLYLNDLNFKSNTALNFNIPLTRKEIPSVQAALGYTGIFEGVSYRGNKALAFIMPVKGTPWIMIAQTDDSEIYAELYFKEIAIVSFTVLLILLLSLALIWIYHYRQKNIYKKLFVKEKELREYHEEFRTILYSIGDGVITTDTSGKIKNMNHTAAVLTGWSEEEVTDKRIDEIFKIVNEHTNETVSNPVFSVLEKGAIVGLANHTLLINKKGDKIPIADSGAPIRTEEGDIEGVVLVFRDKTEEHNAENLVRQSETRLQRAEIASKSGNWELHIESNTIIASAGAEKIYGVDREMLDYETIKEFPLSEYRQQLDEAFKKLVTDGKPYDVEFKIKAADTGEIKDIHSIAFYDKDKNSLFGIIQDITERKNAEKKIKENELFLNNLLETVPIPLFFKDINGKYQGANDAFVKLFGFKKDELIGKNVYDIYSKDIADIYFNKDNELFNKGGLQVYESNFPDVKGDIHRVILHKAAYTDNENKIAGLIGAIFDITELRKAQDILKESEEKHRTTLYSIGDGVIATDEKGNVTQMNPIAEKLTGYKEAEAVGKTLENIFRIVNEETHNKVENPVNKVLKYGEIVGLANHTLLISKDGNEIPIADSGAPIKGENDNIKGVVLVFRDQIKERTAQKALEESEAQLKQSQRVAGIGYYIFDITTGLWTSSEMLSEIFGIDKNYKCDVNGWLNLVHPDYREEMTSYLINHILKDKNEFNKEYKIKRDVDGLELWVHGMGSLELDSNGNPVKMFGTIQDITERKITRNIIEKSLKEKEVLLKEIHHRVKNNFQRIIGLIALQTEFINDDKVLNIFADLQNRLLSMSLIHELMYGSGNFSKIEIKDYIEKLTDYLLRTYSISNRVKLNLELEEHSLDLDSIIPCGLIINEAITNSLKYGFPNNAEGNVNISFNKKDDEFCLILSDDGIGVKEKIDFENYNSLGLRLINLLTKQLKGSLEVIQEMKGLKFIIKFREDN